MPLIKSGDIMNESKDLKKRIIQMRQDNSIEDSNENKSNNASSNNLEKSKVISNKNLDYKDDLDKNKNVMPQDTQTNNLKEEEAFKLLANKFNQSVEVILELTKRVEKLETLVRLQSMQNDSILNNSNRIDKEKMPIFRIIILIGMLAIFFYLFYHNKFDFFILEEIFKDILSLIKD